MALCDTRTGPRGVVLSVQVHVSHISSCPRKITYRTLWRIPTGKLSVGACGMTPIVGDMRSGGLKTIV